MSQRRNELLKWANGEASNNDRENESKVEIMRDLRHCQFFVMVITKLQTPSHHCIHNPLNPNDHLLQVTYKVTVYTGSMKYAGTDEKISIAIAGNRNSFEGTNFHLLDKAAVNDFERGSVAQYEFTDVDVGLIELAVVKIEKGIRWNGDPEFYLEKLRISVGHYVVIITINTIVIVIIVIITIVISMPS